MLKADDINIVLLIKKTITLFNNMIWLSQQIRKHCYLSLKIVNQKYYQQCYCTCVCYQKLCRKNMLQALRDKKERKVIYFVLICCRLFQEDFISLYALFQNFTKYYFDDMVFYNLRHSRCRSGLGFDLIYFQLKSFLKNISCNLFSKFV